MSILENILVIKYFGCDGHVCNGGCEKKALRIIEAMQHPIKAGDLIVSIGLGKIFEYEFQSNVEEIHPELLRVPEKYQISHDPVERKISEILSGHIPVRHPESVGELKAKLHELVNLARGVL